MHYLTIAEYARLKGVSRQAVQDRIRRKTLPYVVTRVDIRRIPVEDTELAGVNLESLAPGKGQA